jgi:hypothetical protein
MSKETLFTGFTGGKCYIQGKEVERHEYLAFTQRQFLAKFRDLHGKDPSVGELLARQNETLSVFAEYEKNPVLGPAVEVETMLQMNNGQITVPVEKPAPAPKAPKAKAAKPKLEKTDKRKSPEFIAHLRALALKRKDEAAAKRAAADKQIAKDVKAAKTAAPVAKAPKAKKGAA